jgi:hypothetical protein
MDSDITQDGTIGFSVLKPQPYQRESDLRLSVSQKIKLSQVVVSATLACHNILMPVEHPSTMLYWFCLSTWNTTLSHRIDLTWAVVSTALVCCQPIIASEIPHFR